MKVYGKQNVLDAALDRIRYLFDEFPNVIVGVSGGKDSAVVYHLCRQVAAETGRLPLKVLFIDQEAEWDATIDQIRLIMYDPDVEPLWFQMPIRLFNATSTTDHWLYCWDPAEEDRWMRPRDPIAYWDNNYGTDRFGELFKAIIAARYPDTPTCYIAGLRAEESPRRYMGLTYAATYKWITWGSVLDRARSHFSFYPIYDWAFSDVWKAIHDHGWPYNAIYDAQYAYGVNVRDMRVSNMHHETALQNLFYMQEAEPDTWARLTRRIAGVDAAAKIGEDYYTQQLPFMFRSWPEYRDYLLDKLIDEPDWRTRFTREFERTEPIYGGSPVADKLYRTQVNSILSCDWELIKLKNFYAVGEVADVRRGRPRQ